MKHLNVIIILSIAFAIIIVFHDYIIPFTRRVMAMVRVLFFLCRAVIRQKDPVKKKALKRGIKLFFKIVTN